MKQRFKRKASLELSSTSGCARLYLRRTDNISKPVTIVGGGLAGLALGIGLRQRGVPVTVWEAGRYPRHRVCGEFICGRGQETLARLGLRDWLERAGAVGADTAAFFSATQSTRPLPL